MKGAIKEKMTDNFLYLWIFITFILNIFFFVNTIRSKLEKKIRDISFYKYNFFLYLPCIIFNISSKYWI